MSTKTTRLRLLTLVRMGFSLSSDGQVAFCKSVKK